MSRHVDPTDELEIAMTVNGQAVEATVPVRMLLSDFIRDRLHLTGTHVGCEHGVCGACTVIVDGVANRSCLLLVASADGAEVVTVEGITPETGLSHLQEAFKRHHALQCGFCTSGILLTLSSVEPADVPDDDAIRHLLGGNICRCTGYENIVSAVKEAWGRGE